jgi:hypothetical protein
MSDKTQQEKNRKVVYNLITTNYYNSNNPETYDVWFDKWFANENTFSKGKNSLFDFLYGNRDKIFAKDNPIRKKIEVNDNRTYYWKNFACDLSWAEKFNVCSGINKPINFDDKVGDYTTDNPLIKKIKISKGPDNIDSTKESLYVNSPYFETLPKLGNYNLADYAVSKLTQSATDSPVFTLSNQSGESLPNATITFDNTGFTFQFLRYTIKATKIIKSETDNSTKKDDTVIKKDKKDDTVVKKDKKDEIPVVRTKPLYFNTYKDNTPSKDCSDFPFTLGCVNSKIGDLNAKLFRGDRKNDKYVKRLQNLLNNSANFNSSNPNMEITKDLWNELMNKQVIKESVKKVLKEYINKKK